MHRLYVIKATGSYALEIKIVRAANAQDALRLANTTEANDLFDKFEIRLLSAEGNEGEIFEASYIEG